MVVGPFWLKSRSTSRPAVLVASMPVAELVQDVRAELDRVGAAELLLREADRELGGQQDAVDRRHGRGHRGDRDLRRDVQRPRVQRGGDPGRGVGDLELPGAVGDHALQAGERGRVGCIRA